MALKTFKPITSAQRGLVLVDNSSLYKGKPLKKLTKGLNKSGGRNNYGHLTARRKGCLLYTSPSPRDDVISRMPSSA